MMFRDCEVIMAEWAYRTTGRKVDESETRTLLETERFLCRSAYNRDHAFIANVKQVAVGHIIHVYFVDGERASALGSFEVVDENNRDFAGSVKQTALQIVTSSRLEDHLRSVGNRGLGQEGYKVDPVVGKFTGWLLKPLNVQTPNFPRDRFPAGLVGSLVAA